MSPKAVLAVWTGGHPGHGQSLSSLRFPRTSGTAFTQVIPCDLPSDPTQPRGAHGPPPSRLHQDPREVPGLPRVCGSWKATAGPQGVLGSSVPAGCAWGAPAGFHMWASVTRESSYTLTSLLSHAPLWLVRLPTGAPDTGGILTQRES